MSKSPTITDDAWSSDPEDWLDNPHAGEMLRLEYLEPVGLTSAALADAIGVPVDRIDAIVSGHDVMDADLDLRLARYFGMSNGFFLRLQIEHDILERRRALGSELERIVPRAA